MLIKRMGMKMITTLGMVFFLLPVVLLRPIAAKADVGFNSFYTYLFDNRGFFIEFTGNGTSSVTGDLTVLLKDMFTEITYGGPNGTTSPYSVAFSYIRLRSMGVLQVYSGGNWVNVTPSAVPVTNLSGTVQHFGSNTNWNLTYVPGVKNIKFSNYPMTNVVGFGSDRLIFNANITPNAPLANARYRLEVEVTVYMSTAQPFADPQNSYLVDISDSLDALSSKMDNLISLVGAQTTQLDNRLLQVISAINNQTGSGGGTQAIVSALQAVGTAIGSGTEAIVAQQKLSTSQQIENANANQAKTESALKLVQSAVDGVTEELVRQAEENQKAAIDGNNQVQGMATSLLSNVQTNWSALSFPIDFTKRIFGVFVGGTTADAYRRAYDDVIGYRYDDDTGGLVAIRADTRRASSARAVSGTTITFPSFSLNVPSVGKLKLWDSHSYDISELKSQFPLLFDSLYVISGIVLIYATVSYIIDLFNDLVES